MEYLKQPKTFDDQVGLIKSRGLLIDDEEKLRKYLKHISYYHLSAYFKSFQKYDKFFDGTTFEDVIRLYEYDKKLRLLLLDVLERIEKAFKCSVIYNLSVKHNDPFWYLDKGLYNSQKNFDKFVFPIFKDIRNSKEVSIKHFYDKYRKTEFPPSWLALEVITFGACVKVCRNLKRNEQNKFSRSFDLDKIFFMNWMHGLSIIRNICAHHTRLWNKNIIIKANISHKDYKQYFNSDEKAVMRMYNWLIIIQIMMMKINPNSTWFNKFKDLISEYDVNLKSMGFLEDWEIKFENIKNKYII